MTNQEVATQISTTETNDFHTNKSVYQHIHTHKYICPQMHIYIYIHIYICTHVNIHINKHTYAYNIHTKHNMSKYNRTYMETYIQITHMY